MITEHYTVPLLTPMDEKWLVGILPINSDFEAGGYLEFQILPDGKVMKVIYRESMEETNDQ